MTSNLLRTTQIMLAATLFLLLLDAVLATNCYYPDGAVDTSPVAPCSSQGGSCCPQNWACLSNGLCYYEPNDYYGRYTCTDRSWDPDGVCPQICTYNNTAYGNEAVKQCSDGTWCCDKDRVHYDCCSDTTSKIEFDFGSPSTYATIATPGSATPVPTSTNPTLGASSAAPTTSSSSPSSTPSTSSTTSSPSSSSSSRPSTSSRTTSTTSIPPTIFTTASTATNAAGLISTIVVTSVTTPSQTVSVAAASNPDSSHTNLAVGLGVGIPGVIILGAAIAFCLFRRHKKQQDNNLTNYIEASQPSDVVDMYKSPVISSPPGRAEIDSYPVAKTNNRSSQISELSSSNRYSIQPRSPAASSISPPQYSPTNSGGGMAPVKEEAAELWGSPAPQQPPPQDWATRRTSYPGQQTYQAPGAQESGGNRASTGGQYQAYRPPLGSPLPQDQGQLGSGLRVMNPSPRDSAQS